MDTTTPLFLPPVIYDTGGWYPGTVVVADVNGDNKPDLIVANDCDGPYCGNGVISVLLGNGDGTFQPPLTSYLPGVPVLSIAVADLNGDGKPDIVLSSIFVMLGNGDGTFQAPVGYDAGTFNPEQVVIADVNGDGKPDLVVAAEGIGMHGTVSVLLGNGDGTFQAAVVYQTDMWWAFSVAVADVNGDGKPDLVVTNFSSDYLSVLLGKGDGTFLPAVLHLLPVQPFWVAVSDVNGDGKPDVVVTSPEGYVAVLLGNGDGTFQSPMIFSSGGKSPWGLALADVNGDGKLDVLVANSQSGSIGVLVGNGDGTFQAPVTYATGGSNLWVVAADVNGDGKPDLVVADGSFYCGCQNGGGVALLLSGMGPRSTSTTTVTSTANPATSGENVTYTASVSSQNGGGSTGTVTFKDGSTPLAIVGLMGNRAAWSTNYTKPRLHLITAEYPGDARTTGSTSAPLNEDITTLPVRSTMILSTSASQSLVGQPVTFTATVTWTYGTIPDGELVTFYDGTATLGSVGLANGTATYTTSSLSARTHNIKAAYTGDSTFKPSSGAVTQVVSRYPTTTTLASDLNPSIYGQKVTFTAVVTTASPVPPTGTVKFTWSIYTIGSATLNSSGIATFTRSNLNADSYPLTAVYVGDAANQGSTSAVMNQEVLETTSTAALTSSPNPSMQGQAVTFTAKISSPTVTPQGPVTFMAGTTVLGTAQLSGGRATLKISSLPVGSTKVTVTHDGDSNIERSSASVTQTVR